MHSGTLVLPVDRTRYLMDLIGKIGDIQFGDMHVGKIAPKRPYKKYVQRIEEMERLLRFLFEELKNHESFELDFHANNVESFIEHNDYYRLEPVEAELNQAYEAFTKFKKNNSDLIKARNAAVEEKCVIEAAARALTNAKSRAQGRGRAQIANADTQDLEATGSSTSGFDRLGTSTFSHIAGVIAMQDQNRFARFLFRATRGNTFTHYDQIATPLIDPETNKKVEKSIFVVYYQDARLSQVEGSAMHKRIMQTCKMFDVNIYPWVSTQEEIGSKMKAITELLAEKDKALQGYERFAKENNTRFLEKQNSGNSLVEDWRLFCLKEKSIYTTLNFFEGETTMRCDIWYPASEEEEIRTMLAANSSDDSTAAMLVTDRIPRDGAPTYFLTNDFLGPTQDLVHTYGVPRYQEITPVIFTATTFPFLFGIMYSDLGHGLLLFLAGLYVVWNGEYFRFSVPELYKFRYTITMMGFFAMYAGIMFNDFFSIPCNFFGSRWSMGADGTSSQPQYDLWNGAMPAKGETDLSPEQIKQLQGTGPYPFGVDPAWGTSQNSLQFMNSLKMKVSVILGVAQMTLGLVIRCSNVIFERNVLDFVTECIPMFIFMFCFFTFMDFMITYKWVTHIPWPGPPSIINNLIAMAMFSPLSEVTDKNTNETFHLKLWDSEKQDSTLLMIITLGTIPFMLLIKPTVLSIMEYQKTRGRGYARVANFDEGASGTSALDSNLKPKVVEETDLSDIWIHQIIETIEYVLGTLSHTASYLRLWALSLAHQQLSLVFFQMTIGNALKSGNWIVAALVTYYSFAMWFAVTIAVLMGMDVMECFLHTLRLHWVEFQSKYYKGDGVAFEPYKHEATLKA